MLIKAALDPVVILGAGRTGWRRMVSGPSLLGTQVS